MDKLAIFLSFTLLLLLVLNPKNKRGIIIFSITIPLLILVSLVFIVAITQGALVAGKSMTMSLLPAIISGSIFYFSLKNKLKNGKLKFPLFLLVFTIIAWILFFYNTYLNTAIKQTIEEHPEFGANSILNYGQADKIDTIKYASVAFKNIQFMIPKKWQYKPIEFHDRNAFQIACWESNNSNFFFIQCSEMQREQIDYLQSSQESLKSQDLYKNVTFSKVYENEILGNSTISSNFSFAINNISYKGEISILNKDSKSYMIVCQGVSESYEELKSRIYKSVKINEKHIVNSKTNSSEIPKDWITYSFIDFGKIVIPPSLELRHDNSFTELLSDRVNEYFEKTKNIKMNKPSVVFQPKGMDNLEKESYSKYSRIILGYYKGEPGDYYKPNERIELTDYELQEIDASFKKEVLAAMPLMDIKLIKWYPLEVVCINYKYCLKSSFDRQMQTNPVVHVDNYYFFNYDELLKLTLSFRIDESELWKSDFTKVLESIEFSNIN